MTSAIGLLLFPGVEELDAVGPWEVLSVWTQYFPDDGYTVFTFAEHEGPVECAKGMRIEAQYSYATAPRRDVLIIPGGMGTRPMLKDTVALDWVRAQRATTPLITSVCTGSLVLAAAGLLAGRPATTHWASLEHLRELDTTIAVSADERFVDDGDIITSSGVSAGIDMALHLVRRLAGAERARQVRHTIQYDPAPPV
ncbi:DJ-1/PfpI family protein [Nocardia vulneris]|uniref:Thiamine biosynthesis protein ThiJ n=1 Tax=Nocardia vulneris TaxID=1141657 RepID=A0ABR4ZC28_9NOCA|nr:DJ-1/PfpI family protein [Nocardia vulneris]KIA62907.1 thiamine biosynthesis protein ThiJ [Nocardia vulneris]